MRSEAADALSARGVVLHQFAFSHFNEKARWALDWKGIEHARVSLLPGPHAGVVRKRSGQTQTPILSIGDEVVAGSSAILARIEALVPEPRLFFPADSDEGREISSWLAWLDEEVGPASRLSLFHVALAEPRYAAKLFTTGQPAWKRIPYAWLFAWLVPMLREKMAIDDETARAADETLDEALDRIAGAVASSGYLVGGRFTAADLTAASLLFPLCFPKALPFSMPAGAPATIGAWLARFRGHPAIEWTETIFARHRGEDPRAPVG